MLIGELVEQAVEQKTKVTRVVKEEPARFMGVYTLHANKIKLTVVELQELADQETLKREAATTTLHPWQAALWAKLAEHPPSPRHITWVVDEVGDAGKSFFAAYCLTVLDEDCALFLGGRMQDMLYTYEREGYIFFNLPREQPDVGWCLAASTSRGGSAAAPSLTSWSSPTRSPPTRPGRRTATTCGGW